MNFLSHSMAACPTDKQSQGAIILSCTSWLAPRCKVDDRNNAQQRNPLRERLGRSLAGYKSRNPIWSRLLLRGTLMTGPAEGNSSQTSIGCGILTQSIPGFETETESRAATAPAAAPPPLQLLPACNLP